MRKKKVFIFSNGRRERKKTISLVECVVYPFFVVEILTLIYVAKRVIEQPRFERPSKEITSFFFFYLTLLAFFRKSWFFLVFVSTRPKVLFPKKKNGSLVLMYLTRL